MGSYELIKPFMALYYFRKKKKFKLTSFRAPIVFLANKIDFKLFKTKNKRDWEGFLWFKN